MIHNVDCREGMRTLADCSVDSIVTDPPYSLGFMNKKWDKTGIECDPDVWQECLRVLKPGGYLLAFSGSRTYHRMTCAIEDAGFEIRDQIMWVYGSGFPKSLDVSKAIDKSLGAEREVIGRKTGRSASPVADIRSGKYIGFGDARIDCSAITAPATEQAKQWQGWGTALKPAHEPICVARKPLSEKTLASNVLKHGTGALNIDGCRVGDTGGTKKTNTDNCRDSLGIYGNGINGGCVSSIDAGRYPANFIHSGIDESWARYFYCAKASKADRGEGNNHPTVKPESLMRHLCRLVTPPYGLILDPFAGSGSTGKAASLEGFQFVGFELEPDYAEIARLRIAAAS